MKKYATFFVAGLVALSLGLFLVHCGGSEDTGCSSNADCGANEFCDLTTKTCKPNTSCDHATQCAGKCCGDDGCPNPQACENNCAAGTTCNPTTCVCDSCTPDCTGRECGPDPVCGEICGTCDAGETCNDGTCETCVPDCTGRVCGPDPVCGDSCGTCDAGYTCNDGVCEQGVSSPGDPCPNGPEDCPDPWDLCLTDGSNPPLTYCSSDCTTDADCGGAPNCCEDFGQGSYCWDPTICGGDGQPGDPCPWGDGTNDDAPLCEAGLSCLGVGADGTAGTCPGGDPLECTELSATWNPDCVSGNCGASFCSEPCDNGACPNGFLPQTVGDDCMCVPESESECTDPVNNVGCDANESCVPAGGDSLQCVGAGDVPLWDPCDVDHPCVEGHVCMPLGSVSRCFKLCDADANTGCPAEGDWYCWGWSDVNRWGFCTPNDLCNMGTDECSQIDDGLACIIFESDPCETRCFGTSGQAEGTACQYSNSCADGLICAGEPGTCMDVCLDNAECTAPDVCLDEPDCDGTWGICGTE